MARRSWEHAKGCLILSLLGSQWGPAPVGLSSSSSSYDTEVSRTCYKCNALFLVTQCPSRLSQGIFGWDSLWGAASQGTQQLGRYPWSGLPPSHSGLSSPVPYWCALLEIPQFWTGLSTPCYQHPNCLLLWPSPP